jgi:hypothetical protein
MAGLYSLIGSGMILGPAITVRLLCRPANLRCHTTMIDRVPVIAKTPQAVSRCGAFEPP